MTPLVEISHPLPSDAVWRKVCLQSGHGKKEKEYTQGWSMTDEPLCKLCQKECMYVLDQSYIVSFLLFFFPFIYLFFWL